jgi:hypothetical protein
MQYANDAMLFGAYTHKRCRRDEIRRLINKPNPHNGHAKRPSVLSSCAVRAGTRPMCKSSDRLSEPAHPWVAEIVTIAAVSTDWLKIHYTIIRRRRLPPVASIDIAWYLDQRVRPPLYLITKHKIERESCSACHLSNPSVHPAAGALSQRPRCPTTCLSA